MREKFILLVEDNPDDEALTLRALKKSMLVNDIRVARDGVEALEHLGLEGEGGEAELPQLVLLDLKLPKVDGIQVLTRLRASPRTQLLPVVILTSSNEDRDVIDGYRLGANSYVRKPVDFNEFTAAVHQLGMYWLVLNLAPPERR